MIRILHLSDPHFGAVDPEAAASFVSLAPSLSPDHTILSGDLTMRARRGEYDAARTFTEALPRPLFVIPGNHDIPALNQPFDRFFSPFRRYRKNYGPDLEPEFSDGKIHIVSANSNRAFGLHPDWSDGFLSGKQLSSVRSRFLAGSGMFRILVLHHPLLSPPGRQRALVKPLPALLDTIGAARIDLVLCGHFHRSQLATAGISPGWKCVVSQAPTVSSTRLQGEPQGFHDIHLSADRITITLRQFRDGAFAAARSAEFIRTDSGWDDCGSQHTGEVVSIS